MTLNIKRISVASDGTEGNGLSSIYDWGGLDISGDGRMVVFSSNATNLAGPDGTWGSFVHDTLTGQTVALVPAEAGFTTALSLSHDGRYVYFYGGDEFSEQFHYNYGRVEVKFDSDGIHALNHSKHWFFESANYAGDQTATVRNILSEESGEYVLNVIVSDVDPHSWPFPIVEVISDAPSGGTANGAVSLDYAMSGDGRFVAFASLASNLVAGDTNEMHDVLVRDRMLGTTEAISVSSSGTFADGSSIFGCSISSDGRYVAFRSVASNLVEGDTNETADVFVRDRLTGTTERISVASDGSQATNLFYYDTHTATSMSANGRFVVFCSGASGLVSGDTNEKLDVFLRDRATNTTVCLSWGVDGIGNGDCYGAQISADGRYIVFNSEASNLVAGDFNGAQDVFHVENPFWTPPAAGPQITSGSGLTTAAYWIIENTADVTTLAVKAQDASDTLTWTLSGADRDLFAFDPETHALTFASARDFENRTDANRDGIYDLTVTVTDQLGRSDSQEIYVKVTDDGGVPTAITLSSTTVAENTPGAIVGALGAIDDDAGERFTFTIVQASGIAWQSFRIDTSNPDAPVLSLDPDAVLDYEAGSQVNVRVRVTDRSGNTKEQTFTLSVTDRNEAAMVLDGTGAADTLSAGDGRDSLKGLAGNDLLFGNGGDDYLYGSAGGDRLNGGSGYDHASYALATAAVTADLTGSGQSGEAAGDSFMSVEGLVGSDFSDTLRGDAGNNNIYGRGGNDRLEGRTGRDQLYAGAGNDTLDGGEGADVLNGGEGIDTASYASLLLAVSVDLATATFGGAAAGDVLTGIENLIGTSGNDTLRGDAGANRIEGGGGNDTILAGLGSDTIVGGTGIDTLSFAMADAGTTLDMVAAAGSLVSIEVLIGSRLGDVLQGDALGNRFLGGAGADTLDGRGGSDQILGEEGNDSLSGGAGDDTLDGGEGADVLDGGDGIDTADYIGAAAGVTIDLATGVTGGAAATDRLIAIENLRGSNLADALRGDVGANALDGGAGNDLIHGGAGADTLIGGSDADYLWGGAGVDSLVGGTGYDHASYTTSTTGVTVDWLNGAINTGDAEGDRFTGIEGLAGTGFDDRLGGDNLANNIYGSSGNDHLEGRAGRDQLAGQTGNDTLDGGTGDDVLSGGAGADLFTFASGFGRDSITDWQDGSDRIDLRAVAGATGMAALSIMISGSATVISLGADRITVSASAGQIEESDFLFAA